MQWTEIINKYNHIAITVLDYFFKSMNLFEACRCFVEGSIPDTLSRSLNTSLGAQYLLQHLKDTLWDVFRDKDFSATLNESLRKSGVIVLKRLIL